MDSLFLALTGTVLGIMLCEGILWKMFRQRLSPLVFPHELDTSYFRFFSLRRLRILAILHTVIISICAALFCLYLW